MNENTPGSAGHSDSMPDDPTSDRTGPDRPGDDGPDATKNVGGTAVPPEPTGTGADGAMSGRSGRWRTLAAAVLTGTLTFVSFPDWDWFALAFVALVPLLVRTAEMTPRQAFGAWWVAGLVANLGGFYWITNLLRDFAYMPWYAYVPICLLLCAQQALVWGLAGWLARWGELGAGVSRLVAWPLAFAAAETAIPLIFPWYLGNSQSLHLPFIQSAELGGPWLVTALVVLVNAMFAQLHRARDSAPRLRRRLMGQIGLAAALLVANTIWGTWRMAQIRDASDAAPRMSVGLVEADIGIYEKHDIDRFRNNLLTHQRLSATLADEGAELIVWPETAYAATGFFASVAPSASLREAQRDATLMSRLDRRATWIPPSDAPLVDDWREDVALRTPAPQRVVAQRGFRVPLLTGVVMARPYTPEEYAASPEFSRGKRTDAIFNTAILLDGEGRVLGSYDKNVLMPFSESVPFGRWIYRTFGWSVYRWIPQAGDFIPGDGPVAMDLPLEGGRTARIGLMICYEDIYPEFGRALNRLLPNLIINVTNDAWFGKTSVRLQHVALSVFRAIEQRTTLVRSTNTGVSCFIDPTGRVTSRTSVDNAETLREDVPLLTARRTVYMMLGNWLGWSSLVFFVFARWRGWRRAGRRPVI